MADSIIDIKGMDPRKIAEALKGMTPEPSDVMDKFWVHKASATVKHIGWIALTLENDDEVREEFTKTEGCSPYSLLGIQKLATDDFTAIKAIKVVLYLANIHDDDADPVKANLLRKAVKSGTWLTTEYLHGISETNKLRWKTAIEDLFSEIEDDHELVERFCTGTRAAPTTEPAIAS
ncbi:hypothetical protein B5E41_29170 [Rhizobium esperanzae]|uniref:Uncharacterized protein n=1 Tax=Rhizobium esperanzae TaxID=1967781 RepID=A0A246DLE3_9HYPH|nr:hypothetical protein [Rhizobium esperanzae]OWO90000.1 hypothetical protein B5E41_29170 [Rhizobium esperanzae]